MAKGIVGKKPLGGGTTGRIIVTDPGSPTDPGYVPIGSYVDFIEDCKSNEGDCVEFKSDGRLAGGITTIVPGKVITGSYTPDITVSSNESVLITDAQLQGVLITINGGYVTVIGNTSIRGKINSATDKSTLIIDTGASMNGDLAFSGASTLSVKGSSTAGAIQSDGNTYASVTGCVIKGKLQIINATECYTGGNTVSGGTDTPNCKPV